MLCAGHSANECAAHKSITARIEQSSAVRRCRRLLHRFCVAFVTVTGGYRINYEEQQPPCTLHECSRCNLLKCLSYPGIFKISSGGWGAARFSDDYKCTIFIVHCHVFKFSCMQLDSRHSQHPSNNVISSKDCSSCAFFTGSGSTFAMAGWVSGVAHLETYCPCMRQGAFFFLVCVCDFLILIFCALRCSVFWIWIFLRTVCLDINEKKLFWYKLSASIFNFLISKNYIPKFYRILEFFQTS